MAQFFNEMTLCATKVTDMSGWNSGNIPLPSKPYMHLPWHGV